MNWTRKQTVFTRFGLKSVFGSCFSPYIPDHLSGCRRCKRAACAGARVILSGAYWADCRVVEPDCENGIDADVPCHMRPEVLCQIKRTAESTPVTLALCTMQLRPAYQQAILKCSCEASPPAWLRGRRCT